ncbi:NAD-specific glutamate dehydrogenase [compost metagenome]
MIEIVASQRSVAAGSQDLEHAASQAQDGNIESAATQVIDGDHAFGVLVQTIGNRRRSGLVEQAQHVQTGETRGVLGGLTLGVVEIRRDGDDRADQLAAKSFLGALAQGTEDFRRDFHRALGALDGLDERHVRFALPETIGHLAAEMLHILQATPHQALDGNDGVQRVFDGVVFHRRTHLDAIGVITHRRRQDHPPLRIRQRLGDAAAHGSDQGIGCAQVDPHGQATLMRLGALSGLGDLQ